jgi:soluble lytic murein transglycosylase-like protein/TolA-binding protein
MLAALVVLLSFAETPFISSVDSALSSARNRNWNEAMTALDRAWVEDPAAFEANNLHYLRGRIAEEQQDWGRALDEFTRIDPKNPLRPLASWHGALASMRLNVAGRAEQLIDELPPDFPVQLRMQLLRYATPELALRILDKLATREARFQKAVLRGDTAALWILLRDRNSDDTALAAARLLVPTASTPRDWRDLAAAFLTHRQFADASSAYQRLTEDSQLGAEAQYQLARIRFLSYDYAGAIDGYRAVAAKFPGTGWEKDAEYQIGTSYWRLRQYDDAENAYLHYINRHKGKTAPENAIRDLVDIYRSQGQNTRALALIESTLRGKLSAATRHVLIFTRAKIFYSQEKYSSALQAIRQLKGVRLQNVAGGTSAEELTYLEALTLSKLGMTAAANTAWKKAAANPDTYYGRLAAEQLGTTRSLSANPAVCENGVDRSREEALARLSRKRRPVVTEESGTRDAVGELMFLELWDEASVWIDNTRRPDAQVAADLAYAIGRYDRAITHARRLSPSNPVTGSLLYPAGFREIICRAAARNGVDPLWLHAIIWQESKYNASALSGASARGLMQFIPDTAEAIAAKAGLRDLTLDRLYDPEVSIQLGAHYWSLLLSEFESPELALAAYNAGPDNVRRWRDKWPANTKSAGSPPSLGSNGEFFVLDIGFIETKRYVQAVFGARAVYGRSN